MNKSVYRIAITVLLMLGMRETFASCSQIQAPKKLDNPMVYNVVGENDASLELKTQYFSQDQEKFISGWFSTPRESTACFDLSNLTDSGQLDPFTITMKLVMQGKLIPAEEPPYDGHKVYKFNNNPNLGLIFEVQMRGKGWEHPPVPVNNVETVIGQNQIRFSQSTGSFGAVVKARYILLKKPPSGQSFEIPVINEPIFKIKTESNIVRGKSFPYRNYILKDERGTSVNLSTNGLEISNPIKSCSINGSSDQNVTLNDIYKRDIDPTASGSTGSLEAWGGNFPLDVNCTGENNKEGSQLKPPKVFVTFTGQHSTTDNSLLNIQTGTGKAKGVSLRLKRHDNNTSIKFGEKLN